MFFNLKKKKIYSQNVRSIARELRADCYAELSVSSPAVAETIASTHCTDPWTDGQAERA